MKKNPFISKIPVISAALFLTIPVSSVRAEGFSLANIIKHAVIHKVVSSHAIPLSSNPLGKGMMVELPEPSPVALAALGGFVGFAAWQWRRRSTRNTN